MVCISKIAEMEPLQRVSETVKRKEKIHWSYPQSSICKHIMNYCVIHYLRSSLLIQKELHSPKDLFWNEIHQILKKVWSSLFHFKTDVCFECSFKGFIQSTRELTQPLCIYIFKMKQNLMHFYQIWISTVFRRLISRENARDYLMIMGKWCWCGKMWELMLLTAISHICWNNAQLLLCTKVLSSSCLWYLRNPQQ